MCTWRSKLAVMANVLSQEFCGLRKWLEKNQRYTTRTKKIFNQCFQYFRESIKILSLKILRLYNLTVPRCRQVPEKEYHHPIITCSFHLRIDFHVPPYTARQVDRHSGDEALLMTDLELRRGNVGGVPWLINLSLNGYYRKHCFLICVMKGTLYKRRIAKTRFEPK